MSDKGLLQNGAIISDGPPAVLLISDPRKPKTLGSTEVAQAMGEEGEEVMTDH